MEPILPAFIDIDEHDQVRLFDEYLAVGKRTRTQDSIKLKPPRDFCPL